MAQAKTVTAAGGALGVGAVAGFSLDPAKGLELLKWLNTALGAVGFVSIITLGAGLAVSVAGNWLMWQRLNEKDEGCRKEMGEAESRWEVRFQQMRSDIKEAFGVVGELTKQVTLLAERSRTNTRTRAD